MHAKHDLMQNTYLKSITLNPKIFVKIQLRGDSIIKLTNDKR